MSLLVAPIFSSKPLQSTFQAQEAGIYQIAFSFIFYDSGLLRFYL